MNLTGKCKEEFEKWFTDSDNHKGFDAEQIALDRKYRLDLFYQLYESMQYGVYEDFFDSVGIYIQISFYDFDCNNWQTYLECKESIYDYNETHFVSRQEARIASIEKANEIYNK
jgi:hypothetical protein